MQTAPTIIWRNVSCYIHRWRNRLRSVPQNTKTIVFFISLSRKRNGAIETYYNIIQN